MSVRLRTICMAAICTMLSSTAMLLFTGIAAACSGEVDPGCGGKPAVTTSTTGSITPTAAYAYGYVDPNGCKTSYVFEYRKSGAGAWGQGGLYETFGAGKQLVSDL